MSLKKMLKCGLASTVAMVLVFQLAACGTLMYPERKGQKTGKIDPNVAILDGLGLLLFIIPGVIAYAVDFSNGTIYLPGTASINGPGGAYGEWASLSIPPDNLTLDRVEEIIASHAHAEEALFYQDIEVYAVSSLSEAEQKLAALSY